MALGLPISSEYPHLSKIIILRHRKQAQRGLVTARVPLSSPLFGWRPEATALIASASHPLATVNSFSLVYDGVY